jgi:hypothetical protein
MKNVCSQNEYCLQMSSIVMDMVVEFRDCKLLKYFLSNILPDLSYPHKLNYDNRYYHMVANHIPTINSYFNSLSSYQLHIHTDQHLDIFDFQFQILNHSLL